MLVHAELESYFEERAREVCQSTVQDWKLTRRPSQAVSSLVSHHGSGELTIDDKRKWIAEADFESRMDKASAAFHNRVAHNHGIREANLVKLLLPVGIDYSDLDQVWLASIDAFGSLRGDVAHQSAALKTIPDPFVTLNNVETLLRGVRDVDRLLNVLKG